MGIMCGGWLDRDHDVQTAQNQAEPSIDPNIGFNLLIARYSQPGDQGADNNDEEILTTGKSDFYCQVQGNQLKKLTEGFYSLEYFV